MGDQPNNPEPAAPPAAPTADTPQSIPLPRFNEVNERMKAAEQRAAELQAELESLKTPQSQPEPEGDPQPPAPPAPAAEPQSPDRVERLELMVKLGVTEDAASLIQGYLGKGLNLDDSMAMMQLRHADKLGVSRSGFDSSTHAVSVPSGGTPPVASSAPEDPLQAVRAIRNPTSRADEALKLAADTVRGQMQAQFNRK